jgi:PAS domain S-box-containing protein
MSLSIRWIIVFGSIALVWSTLFITFPAFMVAEKVVSRQMRNTMQNIALLAATQTAVYLPDDLAVARPAAGFLGQAFFITRDGDIIPFHDMDWALPAETGKRNNPVHPVAREADREILRKAFSSFKHAFQNDLQPDSPVFITFRHNGKNYRSMFSPFPDARPSWLIGVYLAEEEFLGPIRLSLAVSIVATAVISLIASLTGYIFARNIISPIDKLAREAEAIEQHNMNGTFNVRTRFSELREAAQAFARMKSALVRYESRLQESESLYRAIARTANDAIILMDHNHCVSFLNPAAERMFGYTLNQARGMNLHRLIAPKRDLPKFENGLSKFSRTGKGRFIDNTVNVTAVNSFGVEFPVELSLSSLRMNGHWHAVAIIRNIAERKKVEQLRRRLADDLHDGLGGNLTNIKLFAEMTRSHRDGENIRKNLDAIAEICEDSLSEIRNYMNVLDDLELQWESLVLELKQYCLRTLEPHDIKFSLTSDINPDAPAPTRLLYINMQKIVKEAVTNVIKHSNGDAMHIAIHASMDRMQCVLSDNGSAAQTPKSSGRGLLSMTSRAKEMGGVLDISWDSGVIIILDVPFFKNILLD